MPPRALDHQVQSYETGSGFQEKSPDLRVRKLRCMPSLPVYMLHSFGSSQNLSECGISHPSNGRSNTWTVCLTRCEDDLGHCKAQPQREWTVIRYHGKGFLCVISTTLLDGGTIPILLLQIKEPRLREVKGFAIVTQQVSGEAETQT